ncbi:hypothetical protein PR003_g23117 [Phytophthora rubi]|uniref:Uncharacterized protein n=1 Tax=Phytophthora rubi TaxID=129364 RepID=A0A6A4D773_9STRA|nr:hypothetical protein PR001_g19745 [Phytophthora rubi]KAE9298953.1 hypothetical protein PR003_g23117 [Phytophthora rubi]
MELLLKHLTTSFILSSLPASIANTATIADSMVMSKKPNLTTRPRPDVVLFLLMHGVRGQPDEGDVSDAFERFGVNVATIRRVWRRFKATHTSKGIDGVGSRIKGASGWNKMDSKAILERVAAIPMR